MGAGLRGAALSSGSMYFTVPMVCMRGVRVLGHTLQEEGQRAEKGENWRLGWGREQRKLRRRFWL